MASRGRPRHPDILTPREREVLELLRESLSNGQIAERLGITERTAKFHVSKILGKLGLSNREEAATWKPEERRRWWVPLLPFLKWGTVAKIAGAALVAAAAGGVGVLVWALLASSGSKGEESTAGEDSSVSAEGSLGRVAFVREGDIWVKNLGSGEEKRLTGDGQNASPQWSADGQWLAFRKTKPEADGFFSFVGLWTIKADGSESTKIVDGSTESAAWSPTEPLLAYADNSDWTLWLTSADGSGRQKLLDNVGAPQHFAWSPDGSQLAVERWMYRDRPGNVPNPVVEQGIWLIDRDGSGLRKLYGPWVDSVEAAVEHLGEWSSNGTLLSFWEGPISNSLTADGVEFGVLPVSGDPVKPTGQPRALVYRQFLQWSPNASTLVAVAGGPRETFCNKSLARYDATIGTAETLSDAGRVDLAPSWSPDGQRLAFVSAPPDTAHGGGFCNVDYLDAMKARRIWLMDANGTNKRQLTNDPKYADESPLWTADGSAILFVRQRAAGNTQEGPSNPVPVELWVMRPDGSDQRMVVDGLTTDWFGYYGFIDWSQVFHWYTRAVDDETASGPSSGSPSCGIALAPAEKAGPMRLRFGQGVFCWTDVGNEASYKAEGSVRYTSGCAVRNDLVAEEIPFSVTLPENSTSFGLPKPHDARLTVSNAVMVTVEALDAAGTTILSDGASIQADPLCE